MQKSKTSGGKPAPKQTRQRPVLRGVLAITISVGLVAWLLSQVDLASASELVRGADPRWLSLSAVSSLFVLLLRGLRFSVLTSGAGFRLTTAAVAIQVFLNRITPFRLGEVSLPLLLRRHAGEDTASSLVGVLFVRLLDLGIVVFAVALSLALRAESSGSDLGIGAGATLLLFLLLATFRKWLSALTRLLGLMAERLGWTRSPKVEKVLEKLVGATSDATKLSRGGFTVVAFTSVGIFAAHAGTFGCLLLAFGVDLALPELARGVAVALGGAAIPIAAVGTFGTQEASWVAGFTWVGVSMEVAIVTGVAAQLLTLAFAAVFALPSWLWLERRAVSRPLPTPPPVLGWGHEARPNHIESTRSAARRTGDRQEEGSPTGRS